MRFQISGVWVQIPSVSFFNQYCLVQKWHLLGLGKLNDLFKNDFCSDLIFPPLTHVLSQIVLSYNKMMSLLTDLTRTHLHKLIFELKPMASLNIKNQRYNKIKHYIITQFYNLNSNMESLKRQNEKIKKLIENYLEEIEKQKQLNAQHQIQVETLLKFNERLLGIIETQLNTNNNNNEKVSLQAISQRSQRESDLVVGHMNSFIKTRKFGPISERGSATSNSLVQRASFAGRRLEHFARDMKSQLNHSQHDHSEEYKNDFHSEFAPHTKQQDNTSNSIKNEMLHQIQELKKIKKQGSTFYDNKISQIKNLSVKINKYHPLEQLNQINQKLNISAGTAQLLKKIINKG